MDKEDLERDLEKAEKGVVVSIHNQTAKSLHFDGTKHHHGKFRTRPPKVIPPGETASFSLEGRKSIEASIKLRWEKGKLELLWHFPEQGDPKIYYKVRATAKDKLHVFIPSASFGKVNKVLFLIDENPKAITVPPPLVDVSTPRADADSDHEASGDDMSRSNSIGEMPPMAFTPRANPFDGFTPRPFDPSPTRTTDISSTKSDEDESTRGTDLSSYGGDSTDEEDEPKGKTLTFAIKPLESVSSFNNVVIPIIGLVPPSTASSASASRERRKRPGGGISPTVNSTPLMPDFLGHMNGSTPSQPRKMSFAAADDFDVRDNNLLAPENGLIPITLSPALMPSPLMLSPSPAPAPSPFQSTPSPGQPQSAKNSSWQRGKVADMAKSINSQPLQSPPLQRNERNFLSPTQTPGVTSPPINRGAPTHNSMPSFNSLPKPTLSSPAPITSSQSHSFSAPTTPITPTKQNHTKSVSSTPPMNPSHATSPSNSQPRATSFHSKTPPTTRASNNLRGSSDYITSPGFQQPQPELSTRNHITRRYSEPPPVDPSILLQLEPKAAPKKSGTDLITPAKKYMLAALTHLENNSISAAIGNLDLCISLLGQNPEATREELEYSMRYRLFLILLREIGKPGKPSPEQAFLALVLSDIPVKPQHRIVAVRMAIRLNFDIGNYGIAAGLIQFLIDHVHPIDQPKLEEKLRVCGFANNVNSDPRFCKYTCPACETVSNISGLKCSLCQHPLRICAQSYEMINTKAYYLCKLCRLNFSRQSISPKESELKCPFCKVGDLANKIYI